MIALNLKPGHMEEYIRLENDLIYKENIGVLTLEEAAMILDVWLKEHGY
jgi:hypothetical protein